MFRRFPTRLIGCVGIAMLVGGLYRSSNLIVVLGACTLWNATLDAMKERD